MKKIGFLTSLFLILLIISTVSFSQQKEITDSGSVALTPREPSYILAGAAFNSDIVFLGRKSPVKSPYISASAGYYHKSGLFVTGIVSYLAASNEKRIDLFTSSAGYDYYENNFAAGVSATGYVFNNKSYTARSALKANLSAYADYDFDILEIYADATMYFSIQSDFIFSAAISHNFYTANNNLKISPTFSLYSGTQNYYGNYDNNLRFGQHMLPTGGSNSMGSGMMGSSMFNIQNYELSIPVKYGVGRFLFMFFPVYAMPVNAATISDNQNTYKEDLSNTFFWSLGFIIKFQNKKNKI